MNFLTFNNVSFTYPQQTEEIETDDNGKPILPKPIFDFFSATLPSGFTSLIGPNGSGKSTFMLLAAGRVKPQQGKVFLFETDIANCSEIERGNLASFIFQNMEFEQDDSIKEMINQVFHKGLHFALESQSSEYANFYKSEDFLQEVISVFELDKIIDRKLSGISKGEIQRVLMAFSLLYGSKSMFMDEPMFAMEDRQKNRAMDYLRNYSKKTGTPIFIAMHELDLSKKYAENVLLFYPDRTMDFGTPDEVLTKEDLEKAYGVPASMLRDTEQLNRKSLKEAAEAGLK